MTRALPLALVFSALVLLPSAVIAGEAHPHRLPVISVNAKAVDAGGHRETYRGYTVDLSALAGRKDYPQLVDSMRHQIDIVEDSGLSRRVLQFFQTIPVVVDEFACVGAVVTAASGDQIPARIDACYSRQAPPVLRERHAAVQLWDGEHAPSASRDPIARAMTTLSGVVMYRPSTLTENKERDRPVLLHELLHAYHDHILPGSFDNPVALAFYKQASEKHLYPADQYLMVNDKEFFAVTASVILFGKDGPLDREQIRKAQPEYYKYVVWLFGVDPDHGSAPAPVASAD